MGIIKDPTSWRTGFELGLAGFSFPYSKPRKPTAYLYNGVRLPALPKWDKTVYPYAYITRYRYSPLYSLYVTASPVSVLYIGSIINNGGDINQFYYGALSDELKDWRDWGLEWPDSGEEITVWSNSDVYYADDVSDVGGTIYLSASDPVPVYE